MTQPPTFDLPTEPAQTITDRLAQIPLLVLDILASAGVGAPNPGERAERGRSGKPGTRPPTSVDVIDITRTEAPHTATLVPLPRLAQCSRLIWESFGPDEEEAIGRPRPDPSWQTETDWLRAAWPTAQTTLDASECEWVADEITAVHQHLCELARLSRPRRFVCPSCGWPMRLQEGGYFLCDSGAHQHPGPVALEQQWRRKPPRKAPEIIDLFRDEMGVTLTEAQLRQWRARRKIRDAGSDGRARLILPWDVVGCLMPEVTAALDERDRAELQQRGTVVS